MNQRLSSVLRAQWSDLHALLYRLTLRPDAAEDLLQELFLKLSESNGFAAADNPAGYAHRVAVNLALDWRRRERRVRADSLTANEPIDEQPSALKRMIDQEHIEKILDALEYLSPTFREVIVLRFVQDWNYERIGGAIGKTAHQSRAVCYDAVERLRTRLNIHAPKGASRASQG